MPLLASILSTQFSLLFDLTNLIIHIVRNERHFKSDIDLHSMNSMLLVFNESKTYV